MSLLDVVRKHSEAVLGADDSSTTTADDLDGDDREQVEEFIGAVRHEARRQQRGGRR